MEATRDESTNPDLPVTAPSQTTAESEVPPNSVVMTGSGFGHGIGMCQWGAIGMAGRGRSFEQILKHYYPGIRVGTYDPNVLAGNA